MPIAVARSGVPLEIRRRPVPFSFWPTGEGTRRAFLQSRIFASNPWEVIRHHAVRRAAASEKAQVEALTIQGEDLFRAASAADIKASRPLLLYYAFLQLAKAYSIIHSKLTSVQKAQHGMSESLTGATEFENTRLTFYKRVGNKGETENVFAAFCESITGLPFAQISIETPKLFNQVLIGHRLYTQLMKEKERFVEIQSLHFLKDAERKEIWAQIRVSTGDLSRLGYANKELLTAPAMRGSWAVRRAESTDVVYELTKPIKYSGRPSDVVHKVAASVFPCVWTSVSTTGPYRRYYLYRATKVSPILPQLASIYAGFFYLGSLTRYRPANFRALVTDRIMGPAILEFVQNQPMQFLYLLASLFARQEIARAAIV